MINDLSFLPGQLSAQPLTENREKNICEYQFPSASFITNSSNSYFMAFLFVVTTTQMLDGSLDSVE